MQLLLMVLFYLAGQFNAQGYLFSALQFFFVIGRSGAMANNTDARVHALLLQVW